MRDAENGYTGTLLEDHFEQFLELEIYEFMTWNDYIHQPRHELEMVKRITEKKRKSKNQNADKTAREFERRLAEMMQR